MRALSKHDQSQLSLAAVAVTGRANLSDAPQTVKSVANPCPGDCETPHDVGHIFINKEHVTGFQEFSSALHSVKLVL